MFTDWLRALRLRSGHQRTAVRKPPRSRTGHSAACVHVLEPRVLLANPVGPEFQVNTFTFNQQRVAGLSPSVATDADGDFVITWSSLTQDGSGYGIYAQRYDAAGVAQGGEFRVNSFTTGDQVLSAVAMDADGDFVVTWMSTNQDGSGYGIYGQRYNAAGVAQGAEFRVNTVTNSSQRLPRVAMDAEGDFTVIWSSNQQDGSNYGVYGQRYNAAGVAQGAEFRINTHTTSFQDDATIAMDADGDFVVTWSSFGQDGSGSGIHAQRFNAAGVVQGPEFRVNAYTTNSQRLSTVAMDTDGDFVVTWSSYTQDGSQYGIFAQRYNAAGVAQGTEFRVNNFTTNYQRLSTVSMDADGDFVVTWSSYTQDGDEYGIYAQQYSANGVRQGGEFRVNTTTVSTQRLSSVAMDAAGDFVVTWSSFYQDGSGYGVFAQRYAVNSNFNLPPIINPQTFSVAENRPSGFLVGNVVANDPDSGQTIAYAIVGGNVNNTFAINPFTGALTVNNPAINFETLAQYSLVVEVTDNGSPFLSTQATITVNVTNDNEPPVVTLANPVTTLTEVANQTQAVRVADIVVQDDGLGTNLLSLAGADAALFQIVGNQLRLKAGAPVDFETKPNLSVQVRVDDPAIGGTPDSTATLNLKITNVNESPTVELIDTFSSIVENANTNSPIRVATVVVTDDSLGIESLALTGEDADLFEIVGSQLRIKAGSVIDFESTDDQLQVTVTVDDPALGTTHEDSADLVLQVIDVNEAPTLVVQALTQNLAENASTVSDRTVANVFINDDALGTNTLSLSGPDAFSFKLNGTQLQIKAGVQLDFETRQQYSVNIVLNDPAVGGTPDASFNFRLNVVDVNEVPVVPARTFSVATRSRAGTAVGAVTSTDQDVGQFVFYSIVSGNTDNAFTINAATGLISVANSRALRQPSVFKLTVRATDDGAPTQFGQGVITINVVGSSRPRPRGNQSAAVAAPAKTVAAQTVTAKLTTTATPAKPRKDQQPVVAKPVADATSLLTRALTAIAPKSPKE